MVPLISVSELSVAVSNTTEKVNVPVARLRTAFDLQYAGPAVNMRFPDLVRPHLPETAEQFIESVDEGFVYRRTGEREKSEFTPAGQSKYCTPSAGGSGSGARSAEAVPAEEPPDAVPTVARAKFQIRRRPARLEPLHGLTWDASTDEGSNDGLTIQTPIPMTEPGLDGGGHRDLPGAGRSVFVHLVNVRAIRFFAPAYQRPRV